MKYTPLEDPIFESIRVAVYESLGINDEVVLASDGLCKKLLELLKQTKKIFKDGYTYKEIQTKYDLFGVEFKINFRCYYFETKEDYDSAYNSSVFGGGTQNVEKYMNINSGCVCGQISEETFYDVIQHEISHVFDYIKRGGYGKNKILNEELYKKCCKIIGPSGYRNGYLYSIAFGIYLCYPSEQIGFANGLDALLSNDDRIHEKRTKIKNSEEYKAIEDIDDAIESLGKINDVLIKRYLGLSKDVVGKILDKGRAEYIRRIARVLIRHGRRLDETYHICKHDPKWVWLL